MDGSIFPNSVVGTSSDINSLDFSSQRLVVNKNADRFMFHILQIKAPQIGVTSYLPTTTVMALQEQQQQQKQLHFVLVPLMAPGHFIPMLDMAILLSQRDITVTVITTTHIANIYTARVERAVKAGHRIHLLHIKFPAVQAGLPETCQTLDNAPTPESMVRFYWAIRMMQQPFEKLYQVLKPHPSCLITDKNISWLSETAQKFDTIRISFDGMSCFSKVLTNILECPQVYKTLPKSYSTPFVVPGLPHRIELNRSQLPIWCDPTNIYTQQVNESERGRFGLIINSFEELESDYVEKHGKVKGEDRIWCIGPLSMCNKYNLEKAGSGIKPSIDENQCLKWLDHHEPGSVVYVCLGSLTNFTLPQLVEIGLGLEASLRPFIWVIKRGKVDEELEEWLKEGFEERTKRRGLIIRGWAPQVLILSHPGIGAFLTHCGWNSTLEGVSAGVPMITWPMFAEQFFNEKLLVNVLEIGVSIGPSFAVQVYEEDKVGVLVKKDSVAEAVEKVMGGGVEGAERRSRATALAEMAKTATKEGGSSYLNITLLIQDVIQDINRRGQ